MPASTPSAPATGATSSHLFAMSAPSRSTLAERRCAVPTGAMIQQPSLRCCTADKGCYVHGGDRSVAEMGSGLRNPGTILLDGDTIEARLKAIATAATTIDRFLKACDSPK